MKKSLIIVLTTIQIVLLFVTSTLYLIFKEIEKHPYNIIQTFLAKMHQILFCVSIILFVLIIFCCIYLIAIYRKRSPEIAVEPLHPLQNYLQQLKQSEHELNGLYKAQTQIAEKIDILNKQIILHINIAIIFVNKSFQIEIFNPIAQAIFHVQYINAVNLPLSTVLQPYPNILNLLEKSESKQTVELENEGLWFEINIIPIQNFGKLYLIKDITENKKKESLNLINQNYMLLGEIASHISHEIKNSLGVILGYSKTLPEESDKTRHIYKEINLMTAKMESFLRFAKPIQIKSLELIDISQLLRKICSQHNIALNLPINAINVYANQLITDTVFTNLVINSIQAKANLITIEYHKNWQDKIIFLDNGTGIDQTIQNKIFDPFFSTKENGTGMGLATVKKCMKLINGDIQLANAKPGFSEFILTFPTQL